MRKFIIFAASIAALALPIVAFAGGGNSDNAKACQNGGWQNLVRQDGTGFNNQDDCVSYGAHGGILNPKPTSTPGSENFSADDASSKPTAFSGGTIDPAAYAAGASTPNGGTGGSILVSGPYFNAFTTGDGTHLLFTGWGVNSAKLTFTNPVTSVQVEAQNNKSDITTHLTLTGYDASNHVVATDMGTDTGYNSVVLKITSASANIKYFTIATDDSLTNPNGTVGYGLGFSNIVWS